MDDNRTEEEGRAITKAKLNKAEILKTRNEPFTKEDILKIQHRYLVGFCWRELGVKLGINQEKLDNLEHNNDYLDSDRADQVLKQWIDDKKDMATVGCLACALINIGKEEIAERILGEKSKQPNQWEAERPELLIEREEEKSESPTERKIKTKGETSQQPSEQEGTPDQSTERETSEDMLCLVAEIKELKAIVSEQERKEKESEKLQKKMIEEWEEMKLQLQHVLSTKDRASFQSIQSNELKKLEETRKRETSVQQKEKEELKAMIQQCEQMNIQVEQLQLLYC